MNDKNKKPVVLFVALLGMTLGAMATGYALKMEATRKKGPNLL